MGAVQKRRFSVTDVDGNIRTVMPVNFNGKYTYERKLSDGQWFFRRKYSKKIDFTKENGDYQYFNGIEYNSPTRCMELICSVVGF